ncbi:hypothetical protein SDC9_181597 [bioreactor metagenome]|uniref:Uncharacterized protein n=1 Tax=bioreactor metagenome TaxID=1076179 RepID=A0A645HDD3_9ZZZZ
MSRHRRRVEGCIPGDRTNSLQDLLVVGIDPNHRKIRKQRCQQLFKPSCEYRRVFADQAPADRRFYGPLDQFGTMAEDGSAIILKKIGIPRPKSIIQIERTRADNGRHCITFRPFVSSLFPFSLHISHFQVSQVGRTC